MMTYPEVEFFISQLLTFLENPDMPPLVEVEPVYEAGESGLHLFYGDRSIQNATIEAWNDRYPYYMTQSVVPTCYSERHPAQLYIHLPIADIGAALGVNYDNAYLFTDVVQAVGNGTYRAYEQFEYISQILINVAPRLNDSVSGAQRVQYVELNNQLSRVHLNPNSRVRSPNVKPVYENGICGLHVYHFDPVVLQLIQFAWKESNPISWGDEEGCLVDKEHPFLHFRLEDNSSYLISTSLFDEVLQRSPMW